MAVKIYVDTNVYLDYLEGRKDNIRPLGEFAYQIFRRAIGCEFEIVVSDWVINELRRRASTDMLGILFGPLQSAKKLITVALEKDDIRNAKTTGNYSDALHALTAHRACCRFIVTRNIEHFLQFSGLVEPKLPEEL